MSLVVLSLPKVTLGPIDDIQQLRTWRNDPRVYKWCRQYEPVGWTNHVTYWDNVAKDPNAKMYGVYSDDKLVGVTGLTSIDWINRRAEFSIYINPAEHGCGFGESALRALCSHGFKALNLNSIWGEAFEGNEAMKMFRRVGFKEEGRRRQFYFREGKYIDAVLFSLLRSEYGV